MSKDEIMQLNNDTEGFYLIVSIFFGYNSHLFRYYFIISLLKFMMCKRNEKGNIGFKKFVEALDNMWDFVKIFSRIDDNLFSDYSHDGYLTLEDFNEMNKHLNFKRGSPEEIFKLLDKGGKGRIDRNGLFHF